VDALVDLPQEHQVLPHLRRPAGAVAAGSEK